MPFHPWCFDIFCRQSKVRFERINVSGLMKWRNAELSFTDLHSFPWSDDVVEGQEQFWLHVPGKEYLAANPLYVPGFQALLLDAARSEDEQSQRNCSPAQVDKDVFASLPQEIRLLIVGFLDVRDLQNVRLASKAFTTLPNSVWRRLVHEEMPWLWEAWCDSDAHVPSFWTTVTASELAFVKEERERYLAQLRDEYTPASQAVEFLLPFPQEGPRPLTLPSETNWHRVYTEIKQNWGRLLGLRNRQRIWENVGEIIKRIERYTQV